MFLWIQNIMTSTSSTSKSLPFKCNWCCKMHWCEKNKYYCSDCGQKCFRECKRCHKPFPNENYFICHSKHCNACYAQLRKQKNGYHKKKVMEKSILKHLQRIERSKTKVTTLVDQILKSTVPVVKQPRKKKKKNNNIQK